MIAVTKLNGQQIYVNQNFIIKMEERSDQGEGTEYTRLYMQNTIPTGLGYVDVQESMDGILDRIADWVNS